MKKSYKFQSVIGTEEVPIVLQVDDELTLEEAKKDIFGQLKKIYETKKEPMNFSQDKFALWWKGTPLTGNEKWKDKKIPNKEESKGQLQDPIQYGNIVVACAEMDFNINQFQQNKKMGKLNLKNTLKNVGDPNFIVPFAFEKSPDDMTFKEFKETIKQICKFDLLGQDLQGIDIRFGDKQVAGAENGQLSRIFDTYGISDGDFIDIIPLIIAGLLNGN